MYDMRQAIEIVEINFKLESFLTEWERRVKQRDSQLLK